jgi:hypothetical protein
MSYLLVSTLLNDIYVTAGLINRLLVVSNITRYFCGMIAGNKISHYGKFGRAGSVQLWKLSTNSNVIHAFSSM